MARTPIQSHLRLGIVGGYVGAWAVNDDGHMVGWRSSRHWVNALYGMAGTRPGY